MSIFNRDPHAFYALKNQRMTDIKKVKGMRIATSPFTSSNQHLPLVLNDAGLQTSDVKLLKVDPSPLGPMQDALKLIHNEIAQKGGLGALEPERVAATC